MMKVSLPFTQLKYLPPSLATVRDAARYLLPSLPHKAVRLTRRLVGPGQPDTNDHLRNARFSEHLLLLSGALGHADRGTGSILKLYLREWLTSRLTQASRKEKRKLNPPRLAALVENVVTAGFYLDFPM